jgi:hypothetical protein
MSDWLEGHRLLDETPLEMRRTSEPRYALCALFGSGPAELIDHVPTAGGSASRSSGWALRAAAPVCAWFTEGFDTRVLVEAKALLEELR